MGVIISSWSFHIQKEIRSGLVAVSFKLKSDLHTCISLMHGISASGGTGMGSGLWWVRVRLWFIVVVIGREGSCY